MRAMILAAGRGSRMKPLTDTTPKPLLDVGGKPLIVWHIEKLKKAGITDIIINIAWLGDQIPTVLGDGSQFGVSLFYSDEKEEGALETAGAIVKVLPLLRDSFSDDPFLVVNGDVWCDYPYASTNPIQGDDLAHLILVDNPEHNLEGDFVLADSRVSDGKVARSSSADLADLKLTFSGIGYYHAALFENLEYGKRALAPLLREQMSNNKISGEHFEGDWRDIGTPERLDEINKQLVM